MKENETNVNNITEITQNVTQNNVNEEVADKNNLSASFAGNPLNMTFVRRKTIILILGEFISNFFIIYFRISKLLVKAQANIKPHCLLMTLI
jgi:hypothetical protein